jgi:hypothetical protein
MTRADGAAAAGTRDDRRPDQGQVLTSACFDGRGRWYYSYW